MKQIPQTTPDEVLRRIKQGEKLVIIDVREYEEVAFGTIQDAIHIPLADLSIWVDEIREYEEAIIICKTGRRSMVACEFLWDEGIHHVKNMTGGLVSWKGDLLS